MDRFLVDPNSIAKNEGYSDFKIKMIFTEVCKEQSCPAKALAKHQAMLINRDQKEKGGPRDQIDFNETSQIVEKNLQ